MKGVLKNGRRRKVSYLGNVAYLVATSEGEALLRRPFLGGDGDKRFYTQVVPRRDVRTREGRFV